MLLKQIRILNEIRVQLQIAATAQEKAVTLLNKMGEEKSSPKIKPRNMLGVRAVQRRNNNLKKTA